MITDEPATDAVHLVDAEARQVVRRDHDHAAHHIRFNTVSPAVVNTPTHAQANHEELAKLHPLARIGEVSDVVDAVLYLQNATFVTGENIRVDGGIHAGR